MSFVISTYYFPGLKVSFKRYLLMFSFLFEKDNPREATSGYRPTNGDTICGNTTQASKVRITKWNYNSIISFQLRMGHGALFSNRYNTHHEQTFPLQPSLSSSTLSHSFAITFSFITHLLFVTSKPNMNQNFKYYGIYRGKLKCIVFTP